MKFKLKICGMKQAANIAAVAELKPDYLGFIFYRQSRRYINELSAELIKYVPPTIKTTGVFVNEDVLHVEAMILKYQLKAIQLHGSESRNYCKQLNHKGVEVIKAFGIHPDFDFKQLEAYVDVVDYFLFDTQTETHGGSGKMFNWEMLEKYTLDKPFFLSGGIGLEQVPLLKTIDHPLLYAVDLNSKFELEPGLKDPEKLKEFITTLTV